MLFSNVVGQSFIKEKLKYIAQQNKIPHAFLFTGHEGVGKLAMALAFAQYINCPDKTYEDACGICSQCRKIEHLVHPDLHFVYPIHKGNKTNAVCDDFLDEWRNLVLLTPYFKSIDWYNKVSEDKSQPIIYAEEAMQIISKLSVKNYEALYKVVFIYQPERMHIATANKLLKILEEPPDNTVFILISHNPELLLSTIVSRCQVIKFPPVDDVSLSQYLKKKYPQYKENEIHHAVILANGNVPEAIELLEKQDSQNEFFNLYVQIFRIAYALAHRQARIKDLLEWTSVISKLSKEEQKNFLQYCLRFTRDNFLKQMSLNSLVFLTKEEQEFSEKFSPFVPYKVAHHLYQYFTDALYHLERNGNVRIIFTDLGLLISKELS